MDPQELARNFATSSVLDRSKIFAIFVVITIAVLILPLLVCLQVDGVFGDDAKWMAILVPLWMWYAFLLLYHIRVILMGPIPRPETIPEEEWVDPLPMKKRITSLVRFLLLVLLQVLLALKLDNTISIPWGLTFFPLYLWEASTLYKKLPLARMRIVTVEDLEVALGKPFAHFTPAEKELIGKRYSVVSSTDAPDFDIAQKLKTKARNDVVKSIFRGILVLLLIIQLDGKMEWNWYLVFAPLWIMILVVCYTSYHSFEQVQRMAEEKDPTLFQRRDPADVEAGGATNYGAVGTDGAATAAQTNTSKLSPEEQDELRAQVMASSSKLFSKCCSLVFTLILAALAVGKLQGAGYSSLWIISPFLFMASLLLCILGCAIFGIKEVSIDGVAFDGTEDFGYTNAEAGTSPPKPPAAKQEEPVYIPPPPQPAGQSTTQSVSTGNRPADVELQELD